MKNLIKKGSKTKLFDFILIGSTVGIFILLLAFAPINQSKEWTAPPDAGKKANPVTSNEKSIAAGKSLYLTNCKSCHGTKGKGDGPKSGELDVSPRDFSKEKFQKQADGVLYWKITEGRKPMPSFKKDMTEEQRWTVINYVRTFGIKK